MARISGRLIAVGIGKETTRGTAVAPSHWLPRLELDFEDNIETIQNESSLGVLDRFNAVHLLKSYGEGSITGKIFRNSFGHVLANLFGQAPSTVTVESTAKKHTFTLAQNNEHLTHTIAMKDVNSDLRFPMAMIDSLTIDYAVDDYVKYTADFVSKASATASNTVAYATESEFVPKHAVIKLAATGSANLGAASAITDITSLSLEFNKNLVHSQGLGSSNLDGLFNTSFEVTGSFEKYYNDDTYKNYVVNNTHRSMRIDLIDTDTTVGASTNPSLRFDFEEVAFNDRERSMGNDDIVTETVSFTGIFNVAASKTLTAELTNDQASY